MTISGQQLLEEVKSNLRKLGACPRHRFPEGDVRIGQRMTCLECGGEMGLSNIGSYISGYEAGGGNAEDVWPGYRRDRKKMT